MEMRPVSNLKGWEDTEISEVDLSFERDDVKGGRATGGSGSGKGDSNQSMPTSSSSNTSRSVHIGGGNSRGMERNGSISKLGMEATSRGLTGFDDRLDAEEVSFGDGLGPGPSSHGRQQYDGTGDTSDSEALLHSDGNASSGGGNGNSSTSRMKTRLKHFSFSRAGQKPEPLITTPVGGFEQLGGLASGGGRGKGGGGEGDGGLGSSSEGFSHGSGTTPTEFEASPSTPRFKQRPSLSPPAKRSPLSPSTRASLSPNLLSSYGDRDRGREPPLPSPPGAAGRRSSFPPPRSSLQPVGSGLGGLVIGGGINNPLKLSSSELLPQSLRDGDSKMPKYTKLSQQELGMHGSALLTPKVMIIVLSVVAMVFIPIGAIAFAAAKSTVEMQVRYDDACMPLQTNQARDDSIRDASSPKNCSLTLTLEKDLHGMVAVYYELSRFYANHRRYVDSRDNRQLKGTTGLPGSCAEQKVNEAGPILPCGIVAWSFFNDSFSFKIPEGQANDLIYNNDMNVSSSNLAWTSRRNSYGKNVKAVNFNVNASIRGGGTVEGLLRDDDRFIVWMQAPASHTVRKLWGRIHLAEKIPRGSNITIDIENLYNSYAYDGSKTLVLSTTSWLGGNNDFVGVAFFMVGSLALILALMFSLLLVVCPRPLGDLAMLSWIRNQVRVKEEGFVQKVGESRPLEPVAEVDERPETERRQSSSGS